MEAEDSGSSVREDPHSLSPIQLEAAPPSIDEDLARFRRGKSARLLATGLFTGLLAFGVAKWMENIDGSQAYAAAAERVEEINAQQGTALLRCLLPDLQPSQLQDESSLHTALEVASERSGQAYAEQLRACAPLSEKLALRVDTLSVPADVSSRVTALRGYANDVDQALGVYRKYLEDHSYDFVQATPMIERVALAWTSYERARSQLNGVLRDHP